MPRFSIRPALNIAALLCGLGALAVPAFSAAAEKAVFDFYVSGIRVGQVSLDSEVSSGRYEASSRIETAGVVGLFADYFFSGTSTGGLTSAGGVQPGTYEARSRSPRADRVTQVTWQDGTPVSVSVKPPRSTSPVPSQQAGTLDPISAGFKLLSTQPKDRICNTTTDVFDGSRRSRLVLEKPVAEGGELVCEGSYARLEGEAHTLSSAEKAPFRLVFAEVDGGSAELRRVETRTKFGSAVLERRD